MPWFSAELAASGVAPITAGAGRAGKHSAAMPSPCTPHDPKRVLVVDEEEDVRELLKTVLDDAGYAVETAANGAEGLAKISAVQPDLVLLDLNMPVLDGWEVLERLPRLNQPPVVVII